MRIYLLNNTQPYRDDEEEGYAGGWFNCPVDLEEVRERLGVENEEQLEIADYELPFEVHSEMPLWEINVKCRIVQEIEGTPIGNEMKYRDGFTGLMNLSTIRTRYAIMTWLTVRHWQNTLSARNVFSVRFPTNFKSTLITVPTETSWKCRTDTCLHPAAYSAISKGVM